MIGLSRLGIRTYPKGRYKQGWALWWLWHSPIFIVFCQLLNHPYLAHLCAAGVLVALWAEREMVRDLQRPISEILKDREPLEQVEPGVYRLEKKPRKI